ncbi:tumor necrosis factor receptor superfamily member 10B-like isoform X5 [Moschus berezovskii]|uniref:tumor necrosis factor receptor superfamily member 10B-like isoform X5 n=1 Tax=Moschus berezovskii TaxID=68408 RepID=UPI002444BE45|nr:tumor necrosis factor receptor superfamily member 10B-like isoform X5 [Moschus berezovskii]
MTAPTITLRGPRQRTLPDRKGQRGRRAPASSSAGAGRSGGPKLRFGFLVFVMGALLWVKPGSAMSIRKDEVHQQLSTPLEWILQQKLCLPGEEEKNRCTSTKDTDCQCKPGTFRGEDAPEFCQKCSTGCPDGKVMVRNCTPWSNIKCVDQESGTLAHGEAPVPGELAAMSQRLPITPSPSSGASLLVIGIVTGLAITIVLIGCVVWLFFKGVFGECWHKVKKLTEDNAQSHNEARRLSAENSSTSEVLLGRISEEKTATGSS